MKCILETERLRLKEFTPIDSEFIVELLNSPGWLQFIGDRNIKTEEQAKHYLENGPIKSYKENGYGLWLVEKKADNTAIGMCGIIKRETLNHPDLGFAFLPAYNCNGYAFEITSATMEYAKHQLNISKILAITVPNNSKSIRLLEKIKLKFIQTIIFPTSQEELLLYSN